MSVINESQTGDKLICIEEFVAPPRGEMASPETERTFRIGERVRYTGFFQHQNLKDNPVCWMVTVETADKKTYAATQTYFVTEECWRGLKRFFARQASRQSKRGPSSRKH